MMVNDDELNTNPPKPCQIGKRPPAPKPKGESAGHQGVAGGDYGGIGKALGVSAHPRSRSGFFGITFFAGTLFDRNAGIRISSAWASDPQLGLVARCGARAQIHFRGLCHWAGELTARQAAEPPS